MEFQKYVRKKVEKGSRAPEAFFYDINLYMTELFTID